MARIGYAHLGCSYCEDLSDELEEEATCTPGARATLVGFDDHWARYENDAKENA